MKHWQETAQVLSQLISEAAGGRFAALATVVKVEGSAYRRPGAKLVVQHNGATTGAVSGGCLEADVRERALAVLRDGTPRLLHYQTGSDDRAVFGLGVGCNGSIDVFLQPATTPAFIKSARGVQRALRRDEPVAISTVLDGVAAGQVFFLASDGGLQGAGLEMAAARELASVADDLLRRGDALFHEVGAPAVRVFTQVLRPPPHLVVLGAGDDAVPLVRYARDVGFRVTLVDHRPAFLSVAKGGGEVRELELRPEDAAGSLPLGPGVYAVVKTHSFANDREWIRRLVQTEVAYIGVLGPRARLQEILHQVGADADDRVFGPVGLDVGAEGPEQIAISIIAEMLAVRSGRAPGHLRSRRGAIHG